jgi:hypothetical protein
MSELVQRIPAELWANLQEVLWRMDSVFLRDVSQITKIPYSDLRKVIPTRGVSTRIPTDGNEPWWHGLTCRMSVLRSGGMWVRCSGTAFEGACCFKHKSLDGRAKLPDGVLPHDSPALSTLPHRIPFRIEGVVYWVCASPGFSEVYNVDGDVVQGILFNYEQRWLIEGEPDKN